MIKLIGIVAQLLTGLCVFALPNITRREILFGVIVPDGFRSSPPGLRAVRVFRAAVAASTLAGAGALLLLEGRPFFRVLAIAPLVTAAVALVAFVAQNRRLKPFAVPLRAVRELDLTPESEHLPWYAWTGLIPLMVLAAAALYLYTHWNRIPETYPIHWGLDGRPNGWAHRTFHGVYGPLLFGASFSVWLFAFTLATWYGSRRSEPLRKPMMLPMLAVEWMVSLLFGGVSLSSLIGPKFAMIGLAFLPAVFASIVYLVKKSNEPRALLDPTPAECWKGGMIYYNPDDAAVFVGRRDGVGLTSNMANPWSWVIIGSLPVLIAIGFLAMR